MATIQAAVVEAFGEPSPLRNLVVPVPRAGEILVISGHKEIGLVVVGFADLRPGEWIANCGSGGVGHRDVAAALPVADEHGLAGLELHLRSAIHSMFDRLEQGAVPSCVVVEFPS